MNKVVSREPGALHADLVSASRRQMGIDNVEAFEFFDWPVEPVLTAVCQFRTFLFLETVY